MQIEVKRSNDYWNDSGCYTRKVVPDDFVELSEELYLCDEKIPGMGDLKGRACRLISGIRGSTELGWHFSPGWVTICPINSDYAVFRGIRKEDLKKVDASNDTLLEILRET